jgi:hypothetical protein
MLTVLKLYGTSVALLLPVQSAFVCDLKYDYDITEHSVCPSGVLTL